MIAECEAAEQDTAVPIAGHGRERASGERPACVMLDGGARGSTLSWLRGLGRRGVSTYVVVLGEDMRFARVYASSRYSRGVLEGGTLDEGCLERLLAWGREQGWGRRPVLWANSDALRAFCIENREALGEVYEVEAGAGGSGAWLDKCEVNEVAVSCGLRVPRFSRVQCEGELEEAAGAMRYPVVVKPTVWQRRGARAYKAEVYRSEAELMRGGAELLAGGAELLVQEYVEGADEGVEYYLFYRSLDGRRIYGCTGRKLRQYPRGAGVMVAGEAVWLPEVEAAGRRLVEGVDHRGAGGVEFKRREGELCFIEMNTRLEACHGLAQRAGVDLLWHAYADQALGEELEASEQRNGRYLNAAGYGLLWREMGWRALGELASLWWRRGTHYDIWAGDDWRPWWGTTKVLLRGAVRRMVDRGRLE